MTDEAKALVERVAMLPDGNAWPSTVELLCDLRDCIETQAREIERLREDVGDRVRIADIFLAEADAEIERLRLDVEAQEALQVSAYHAGLRAGWNFGVSDDNAGMQAAMADTDHIKELRRIREARAALAGDSHDQ